MFGFTSSTNYNIVPIPYSDFAQTNKVYFSNTQGIATYVKLNGTIPFVYKTDVHPSIADGCIALNGKQRDDMGKKVSETIGVSSYMKAIEQMETITLHVELLKLGPKVTIDCQEVTEKLKTDLGIQPLSVAQSVPNIYRGTGIILMVANITCNNDKPGTLGMFNENTTIVYVSTKANISLINQASSSGVFKGGLTLSSLGVGGLNDQTSEMFTKAFVSRINPELSKQLGIKHTKGILLYGPPGCGKCLGINTPVLMYDGTIKMVQDVAIGDKLMGDDSTPREVLSLARGKEQMYKIKQEEGDDYIVNESHILSMRMSKPKKLKKTKTAYKIAYFSQKEFVYRKKTFNFADYKGNKQDAMSHAIAVLNEAEDVDVVDIALTKYLRIQRDPRRALKGYKVSVNFAKQELKYDPYLTGLLLAQANVINENTKLSQEDMFKLNENLSKITKDVTIDETGNVITSNIDHLQTISISAIPYANKSNSKNSRIRLLAGILDLKGDLYKKTYRFSTTNETFANDVIFICRSLGFICTANKVILPNSQYIRVKFTGKLATKMPCVLERNITTQEVKENLNTIITVEKLGVDDYYGFEIDGNKRFLLGDFTVTHNTLLAREIGKVLNCVEPIIVNGPELIDKYYGESEKKVRELFSAADADTSGQLHVIIFDEADALCRARGSSGSSSLGDGIVNQLLTKIDGYKEINNVLLIFMTNRKDLIDDAILRPGRIELHIEINLPDEKGRQEILSIHTREMRGSGHMVASISLSELAKITENFTGAELAKVVKDAALFAMSREINIVDGQINKKKINPTITFDDFTRSVNEITPMFGRASNEIQIINSSPFIFWKQSIQDKHLELINKIALLEFGNIATILVSGKSYIGKTKFVANLARESGISCVKIITIDKLIRSPHKAGLITNTFEICSKATNSILILDGFERLIEWLRIGPRFNNEVLQTIIALLTSQIKPTKKMTIICTAHNDVCGLSGETVLDELGVSDLFDTKYDYPDNISHEEIQQSFPDFYENSELNIDCDVSATFKLMKYAQNKKYVDI